MDDIKKKMGEEALKRLKSLNTLNQTRDEFEHGIVSYSDNAMLFWVSDYQTPGWPEKIKAAEEEYGIMTYHAILTRTEFGQEFLALLYVSDDPDEWKDEREELEACAPTVYMLNLSDPDSSKFCQIGIKPLFGGLLRTA